MKETILYTNITGLIFRHRTESNKWFLKRGFIPDENGSILHFYVKTFRLTVDFCDLVVREVEVGERDRRHRDAGQAVVVELKKVSGSRL